VVFLLKKRSVPPYRRKALDPNLLLNLEGLFLQQCFPSFPFFSSRLSISLASETDHQGFYSGSFGVFFSARISPSSGAGDELFPASSEPTICGPGVRFFRFAGPSRGFSFSAFIWDWGYVSGVEKLSLEFQKEMNKHGSFKQFFLF
jgi:hypothetical protein